MEEKLKELHKPVQYIIMALEEVIKSQKSQFDSEAIYVVYKGCIKHSIDKIFE